MPLYWCFIRGENFPPLDGSDRLMGFYTGRHVEAPSPEEAEQAALAMLRTEYQFNETQRAKAVDARIYFEELFEVESGSQTGPNKGACWFDMDDVEQRDKSESECR